MNAAVDTRASEISSELAKQLADRLMFVNSALRSIFGLAEDMLDCESDETEKFVVAIRDMARLNAAAVDACREILDGNRAPMLLERLTYKP